MRAHSLSSLLLLLLLSPFPQFSLCTLSYCPSLCSSLTDSITRTADEAQRPFQCADCRDSLLASCYLCLSYFHCCCCCSSPFLSPAKRQPRQSCTHSLSADASDSV